jgi:hypothetical protein
MAQQEAEAKELLDRHAANPADRHRD